MPHLTKSQREHVKYLIADYTLRRYSERDIAKILEEQHQIKLSKAGVRDIRVATEKTAESWYNKLRDSRYKYLATYRERIESLFRYQRVLNNIIDDPDSNDMAKIQAVSGLHRIEMDLVDLYKGIPDIGIQNDTSIANMEEITEPIL